MPRGLIFAVVAIALACGFASPAAAQRRGAAEPLDPARVLASIDRAVGYLKRQQNGRGGWDDGTANPGGVSSLATLALLEAGIEPDDTTVAAGLEYVRQFPPKDTYVVALQTMALAAATPRRDRMQIEKNARWLEKSQSKEGDYAGGWSYGEADGRADPSNSQFALMGLYAAQEAGVKVDPEAWRRAGVYWRKRQNKDGSWHYTSSDAASGSMTCAGVGALVIISLASGDADALIDPSGQVLCCQSQESDPAVERGLAWLGRNFSVRGNPVGRRVTDSAHYYYLYALERVGRLTSQRFIDQHDWYREGTEHLVNAQDQLTDSWIHNPLELSDTVSTSFALLFLAKGRRPVVMAKAKAPDGEDARAWASHRRDATHLVAAAEEAWDLPMTWQAVDAAKATVPDLALSPVLYASGDAATQGLTTQGKKLRDYIDKGGFLLVESPCDGGQSAPREAIERLVAAVFPEPEYRLRQVEASHPLWRMERLVRPDSPYVGSLWGVEYGCRTCLVFCDRDLSCYWELDAPTRADDAPAAVKRRIEDARTIGLNVLAYATNREPRGKEQQFVEEASRLEFEAGGQRGLIEVAKLRHAGGCNDAPGALANLLRAAGESDAKLSVAPTPVELAADDPALPLRHFAFTHGRRDFRLSAAERTALGEYLTNGGTLLADAICASPEFAKAFRREVAAALPGARFESIPPDDPLLTPVFGGFDIRLVDIRDPQPTADDQPLAARTRRRAPRLEGVQIDGRWAVVFSPYDLSCALEQHEAVQCRGYSKEDAARIGLNVLLYSINQ
ncbi:hypothetical protein Pla108_25640 [Botrimarina colliarenosi]|uniref:DUF4159 domain-containing protein n=1 Tax=Botrimarina colliarenosi TaxID=2528001 RepID=A0A5C6ABL4_9BACT|nr:DUF4159 domain-containing protein [Botrimarina colliarenosi]TWT96790.1 hypothetical protein Pla108_25640 [Botrimarina colliarenosi]